MSPGSPVGFLQREDEPVAFDDEDVRPRRSRISLLAPRSGMVRFQQARVVAENQPRLPAGAQ